ncbi:MAG: sigma-70 family RNA polymerase sigma factor [Planctomycetota bacterium]
MDANPHLDELLLHAAWARRLARTLVADPNTADDLVQEAYVAAASGAYSSSDAPRGWLATVLRNFARRRRRGESARTAREHEVARAELLPGADDRLERAQLEHALAALVLALDAPYRDTLLLRYFEGLTSAEIARRHGVPEATVRSRLARALEQLRARLDRERGGRDAWMGAFVAAFGLPELSAVPAGSSAADAQGTGASTATAASSSALPLVAAALVVALLIGLGAFVFSRASSPSAKELVAGADVAHSVAAGSSVQADTAREAAPRTNAAAPPLAALTSPPAPRVRVRGRVVRSSGEPEAGVVISLHAFVGTPLESFCDLFASTTTDALGAFDLGIDTARACRLELGTRAAGFARRSAAWNHIEPGTVVEAGDVVLAPAARLEVTLRDAQGRTLTNGWIVRADAPLRAVEAGASWIPLATPPCDSWRASSVSCSAPTGDRFVLDTLAAGRFDVVATHVTGFETSRGAIDAVVGTPTTIELGYDGLDPERCITVRAWGGATQDADIALGAYTLRDSSGVVRTAVLGPNWSALFANLAPGEYVAEIHDARFAPWQSETLQPGAGVTATLRGLAELELHVRRRPGGEELDDYELGVDADHGRANTFKRCTSRVPEGRVYDVAPGRYVLALSDGRERTLRVTVDELLPGEHRVLDVAFERATRLTGRVVEADGTTPVVGARVVLQNPWSPSNPRPASRYRRMNENDDDGPIVATTHTDETGAFDFSGAEPGTRIVRVEAGPRRIVRDTQVVVVEDDQPHELHFTLPACGAVHGQIVLPSGADGSKHVVELAAEGAYESNPIERDPVLEASVSATLEADGRFAFERVAPGRYELNLVSKQSSARPSYPPGLPVLRLGVVELTDTETSTPTYDLTTTLPGELRVRVTANGAPLRDAEIAAVGSDWTARTSLACARTDETGCATITGVPPGTWTIAVEHERRSWTFRPSEHATFAAGGTAELVVDVPLVTAVLQCVDATTNAPIANTQVWWVVDVDGGQHGNGRMLDALGRAEVEAPPGEYSVARTGANIGNPNERVPFTWPSVPGTVVTVRVP